MDKEGIFAGISSGSVIAGALKQAERMDGGNIGLPAGRRRLEILEQPALDEGLRHPGAGSPGQNLVVTTPP